VEHSLGGQQWTAQLMERVDAGIVPSVGSIQQCQNRAGIDAH
jgi:hypothetical protein